MQTIDHDQTDQTHAVPPVRFDTKLAVLVRDDLATWQRLNVTAFCVSGLAARLPELIGDPYVDADETHYLPMFRQPVLIFEANADQLRSAHAKALFRDLPMSIFITEMFSTGHDAANRAAVRAVARADLDLVGLALHGPKNAVDKVIKGARMHP